MSDLLAMFLRSTCDECGSVELVWSRADQLVRKVPEVQRAAVLGLVSMLGPSCTAWRCKRCGNFGVFGPTVYSD